MMQITLVTLLEEQAIAHPGKTALIFLADGRQAETLTYGELDWQARNVAAQLRSKLVPGDRLLLLYPAGFGFVCAFLGCLYAGVIAIPVPVPQPRRSFARIKVIAHNAQAKFLLCDPAVREQLVRQQQEHDTPPWGDIPLLSIEQKIHPSSLTQKIQRSSSDTLALLQYTSGSTGAPKGVMVSHGNILHNSATIQQSFQLHADSVCVSWLPHFHDMGLIDGIIQPLFTGCLGVLMPPAVFLSRPLRWLGAIARYRGTHSGGPNFAYDYCVKRINLAQTEHLDLSSWESAYCGAEPIRWQTLQDFGRKFQPWGFEFQKFYPCYGLAESTLMVSGGELGQPPVNCWVERGALSRNQVTEVASNAPGARPLVGCGHPYVGTVVKIVDPQTQCCCNPGEVGEIWVKGDSIAKGYWQQPALSATTFQATLADTGEGPFLRTGDLGFVRQGELYLTGRLKDVIIIGGANHYPQDIEASIVNCNEAVQAAAAFSFTRAETEYLAIACEIARTALKTLDAPSLVSDICQVVRQEHELSVYDLRLVKPATLPKTSSGKLQRRACRESFEQDSLNVLINVSDHPALGITRVNA